ncbi:MAG: dihydrofolate reductase, partial [Cyclobacteriaceae bacterium]
KAKNNGIGLDGELPWHLPSDLRHFKKHTTGHHVLMGRKTFESLGEPLPGRIHFIMTKNPSFKVPNGHFVVHGVQDAIKMGEEIGLEKLMVLGGAEIYKQAIPLADEMIITEIDAEPEADTFFPAFDEQDWVRVKEEFVPKDEKNPFNHTFVTYIRKS